MKVIPRLIIFLAIIYICKQNLLDYTESDWADKCKTGTRQSPINFPKRGNYTDGSNYIKLLDRDYTPLSGQLSLRNSRSYGFNMTNQGTLWVLKNDIKYKYNLIDMHIHVRSEHRFDGKQNDMEIHLVHQKDVDWITALKKPDPDSENTLLTIAVMFNANFSDPHPTITKMDFENLGPVNNVNINDLIDLNSGFYHYLGSVTTPDCLETVNWVVLQNTLQMSKLQLEAIVKWIEDKYKSGNARKTKELNNRQIWVSKNRFTTYNYLSGKMLRYSNIFLIITIIFIFMF
jgi:carbonic anhydrase